MSKTNSPDLIHDEINKLAEAFPQFVSEGKVDITGLQSYLDGQTVEGERYNMNRHGKSKAKLIAREPSTATLRPDVSQSKDRDTTGNMLIEGDNLEVLKLLQNHYYEQVKCIYIDPPYNKDKDFVYRDTRKDPVGNYMRITGQIDDEGEITTENNETTGRKHSNWLSMMYPRLYLARKLLKDDGVIFVSIDDDEVANLRKLMDEIFGEENFIVQFVREKHKAPKNDNKYVSENHEYVVMYAKNREQFVINKLPRSEKNLSGFTNPDNDLRGKWTSGPLLAPTFSNKTVFPILRPNGTEIYPPKGKCRAFSQDKIQELIQDNRIRFGQDGGNVPRIKRFLDELSVGIVPTSVLLHDELSGTQKAANRLKELFGGKKIFDFSKPIEILNRLITLSTIQNNNDIILDFFAGSGTTGHAVMDLNAEDDGNRKYILVQLPEAIADTQEAYKAGYRKISEITRDRLLKAGEKIGKGDTGFRFFKLDTSNFAELDPITIQEGETTDEQLFDRLSLEVDSFGIKSERADDDIITELLIRNGYSLHSKIEQDSEFSTWYHITDISESKKSFFLSLEDTVSDEDIAHFVKKYHNYNQTVFVCKDDAISSGSRLTLANYFPGFTTL